MRKRNHYITVVNTMTLRLSAGMLLLVFVLLQGCNKRVVYGIGDSTMAHYDVEALSKRQDGENYPLRGWGMYFGDHFKKKITFKNKAISGRSSKSFRGEGHWNKILDSLKRGDYVLIQFGHNDQKKEDSLRYTDPRVAFGESLSRYIREIRGKGAHPILATSIARRSFDGAGTLIDTHMAYTLAVFRVAAAEGVPLLDLNQRTMQFIDSTGFDASKNIFLHIAPGRFTKLPDGLTDNTHLNEEGGKVVAAMAADELRRSKSPLKRYLKN
jgi:lysophospholipase L1-like esterase